MDYFTFLKNEKGFSETEPNTGIYKLKPGTLRTEFRWFSCWSSIQHFVTI